MYQDSIVGPDLGDALIGMAGTFDVENYGDLLFPLIAAEALKRRNARIRVAPFSPNARKRPPWPFDVHSLDDLPSFLPSLSAMLIGGGQLIRFDGTYPVSVPAHVEMPVAYWLVPAAQAALAGKPVIWNGVGAWTGSPRAPRYDDLVRQGFAASHFIGVRDAASRNHLADIAPDAEVDLLPDTAFGLSRLWPLDRESPDFERWRNSVGLGGRYVVVQASAPLRAHRPRIETVMRSLGVAHAVILPICRCHGDRDHAIGPIRGRISAGGPWPTPRLIAEIIGRSEFVFASSLHAAITALSYGVPAARAWIDSDRKFELLDGFEGIVGIENEQGMVDLASRGRRLEPGVLDHVDRLDRHWDAVAAAALRPPPGLDEAARIVLLDAVERSFTGSGGEGRVRPAIRNVGNVIMPLRRKLAMLRDRILDWFDWRVEALREAFHRRPASPPSIDWAAERRRPTLNLASIAGHRMKEEPYRWAAIDRLFSDEDAVSLASTFPHDKFKDVAGYDGEKGFRYMARSLIQMGASSPSHPGGLHPIWLALAEDLLSIEYRDTLAAVSGLDLSAAEMEANVIHYGPGAWLGPHVDLKEKILTHILYFNTDWDPRDGGCLNILQSRNPDDIVAEIHPLIGNSSLLVRSDRSWHSVSPVSPGCTTSRRSLNVIFHLPGSVSTMWPPRARARLRDYVPAA